jgi:oligogalacturonide transporter
MQLAQVLSVPLVTWVCLRFGNRTAYQLSLGLMAASLLAFRALSFDTSSLPFCIIILALLIGAARSGGYMVPWNIYNSIADVDEMITGRRREGLFAGVMMLARRIAVALAIVMVGAVLQAHGFTGGGEHAQSPHALLGVARVFAFGPALCIALGLLVSVRFHLDAKNHRALVGEVERLRAGGRMDAVTPATRRIIEQLTGSRYERCWKRL